MQALFQKIFRFIQNLLGGALRPSPAASLAASDVAVQRKLGDAEVAVVIHRQVAVFTGAFCRDDDNAVSTS